MKRTVLPTTAKENLALDYIYSMLCTSEEASMNGVLCPFCDGGSHQEKSMSVGRTHMGMWYRCWRNSCGQGGLYIARTSFEYMPTTAKEAVKLYNPSREMVALESDKPLFDKFVEKYDLSRRELATYGVYSVPDSSRPVAYTVFAPDGHSRGHVLRDIENKVSPKAKTFLNDGEIALSWCRPRQHSRKVVAVEDPVSAIKVARYANSVALLTTKLSYSKVEELVEHADEIVFALDPDAHMTALYNVRKYGALFDKAHIVFLVKDPKDMDDEELMLTFARYTS